MNLWGKRAGSTNLTNYGDVGVKHGQEVPFVLWHGSCLNIPKGEVPERHVHLEGVEIHFILLEPMF
jgi:hypothetical protein